ncbi:insulinase family protein [Undibacterium sp. CY18W]|uniref:Insulinase family protein n=1 Tax=Undibacterium hunanense TaxID=2762292 RepID=A0ABR6ZL61_9BURK|nr:pitrilysin family protein [Undibacterium hunanense]MBC3916627.1 insulinase family protein [Undibacterium hunanense]
MKSSRLQLTTLSLSIALACAAMSPATMAADQPAPAAKTALPAGLKLIRQVEGIDEYQLANGMRVLLVPDASKPTTTVNITYRVGSRHENYGETGMAHLLEHLMFKGSKSHPRLWEELAQRGVQFNGTTSLDRTNYYETFAAKPETLAWAISMEADRMVNSRISGDDLKTEFSVVRNEMEKNENSPVGTLIQRVISSAHQWHNYGKDTIGARTDVENVNIPHLQAFWRKYYQPDNSTLIIAGAFDAKQALQLVSTHFGKIPKPKRQIETTYTLDPVQDGERDVTVRRVGDSQAIVALYHTVPAAHPDYAATEALALILGDTPNGRLYKALVETKKTADVFPWAANLEEPGFLLLGANMRTEQNVPEAKKILLDTIESFDKTPVTEAELARAKAKLDSDIAQIFNDPEKLGVSLSESIASGDWRLFFLFRDRVKALKVNDVQRVATTWLKSTNRTSGSFIPSEKPERVPAPAKVAVDEQIKEFKPGVALAQAENFVTTADNIDKRTQTGALSNGLKYALLPKTTRGNTVVLSMMLNMGDENSLKGKASAGQLAAAMLNRGTEKLSHQQFTEELDKLRAKLQISGSASTVYINVETIRDNLPRVLELLHDALRQPAFSETEFTQLINAQLAQLEESRKDPQAIAVDAAKKALNTWPADDPRYQRSIDEQIAALKTAKLADAKAFWKEFYGVNQPTQAQLSIVGEFDAAAIKTRLQTAFGDWKAQQNFSRLARPYSATKAEEKQLITPDKANAFFYASMQVPVGIKHADYPALMMGNYLLGGSFNSRILERIRQKDGVSYGGGSYFNASSLDEVASFSVAAIYAPQNRVKLETGIREEITRALKDGFTAAELEDGKKSLLQQMQLDRSQDNSLASTLTTNLYLGRNMQFDAEVEKKIQGLSVATIKDAMNRHLGYDKLVRVFAGDFK